MFYACSQYVRNSFMPKSPLLLVMIATLLSTNSAANEQKLIVAFSELPPSKVFHEGRFSGAYAEFAREMAKQLALQIEFRLCSLIRCLHMMESGAADIIIGVKHTPERKKYIQFLNTPYRSSTEKVFYMRNSEHRQLAMYSDLYNFEHIGVKRGAKYFNQFDNDSYLNKVSVSTNSQNFAKLMRRRINLMIINKEQGEYLINVLGINQQIKKAEFFVKTDSYIYLGISKNSKHIQDLPLFESAMSKIVNSGTLDAIMNNTFFKDN